MSEAIERVLVAGASGKTGRELLQELRGTRLTIRGFTSSPEKAETLRRLGVDEVVIGDLLEPRDAVRAVRDVDVVFCAVGTAPGLGALRGDLVDGAGVVNLVNAAANADVDHFVLESSLGVGTSREQIPSWFRRVLFRILPAKEEGEKRLRRSGVTYTILRPGRLTDEPATGEVVVGEGGETVRGSIPRADVARLMVSAVVTPAAADRTFEIASREGLDGTPSGVVEIAWNPRLDGVESEEAGSEEAGSEATPVE